MIIEDDFNDNSHREHFKGNYDSYKEDYRTMRAPVDILYDNTLSSNAKVLFLIIYGLSFKQGYCYATNPGLAERMAMDPSSIKKYLTELKAQGLIYSQLFKRRKMIRRKIFIEFDEMRSRYKTLEQQQQNKSQTPFNEE